MCIRRTRCVLAACFNHASPPHTTYQCLAWQVFAKLGTNLPCIAVCNCDLCSENVVVWAWVCLIVPAITTTTTTMSACLLSSPPSQHTPPHNTPLPHHNTPLPHLAPDHTVGRALFQGLGTVDVCDTLAEVKLSLLAGHHTIYPEQ